MYLKTANYFLFTIPALPCSISCCSYSLEIPSVISGLLADSLNKRKDDQNKDKNNRGG